MQPDLRRRGEIRCQQQHTVSAATTLTATFAQTPVGTHVVNIDGNGGYDALTDGLLVLRYLFGLSGPALINGAVGAGATRSNAADIGSFMGDIKPMLDIDGNGQTDALTDGLLVMRYLFGLRGPTLIQNAVALGATRTTAAQIEAYIQSLLP